MRLPGRLRRRYGPRFFDALTADAWYAKGPFLRAVDKLGWLWIVVLKRKDMEVYQEALQLSQGQEPGFAFHDEERDRQVRLWEVKDLNFSDGYAQPVRGVRSEEQWVGKQVQGGKKRSQPKQSRWLWVACAKLEGYAGTVIYQGGIGGEESRTKRSMNLPKVTIWSTVTIIGPTPCWRRCSF